MSKDVLLSVFWSSAPPFWFIGLSMPMSLSNHACRKNCADKNMEFTPCFPGVDPPINSGWTEVEPGMELTSLHLKWDIYGTGTRDGVDPQKVDHEYESRDGSGDGSGDGVDPPDN